MNKTATWRGWTVRVTKAGLVAVVVMMLLWCGIRFFSNGSSDASGLPPDVLEDTSADSWNVSLRFLPECMLPSPGGDSARAELPKESRGQAVELLQELIRRAPLRREHRPLQTEWLTMQDGEIEYRQEAIRDARHRYVVTVFNMMAEAPLIEILQYRNEPPNTNDPASDRVEAGSRIYAEGEVADRLYRFLAEAYEESYPGLADAFRKRIPGQERE